MSGLFSGLALLCYAVSSAGFLVYVFRQNKKAARGAHWVLGAGFGLQAADLIIRAAVLGQLPVLNMTEALGFFGLTLSGGYLILYWRFRLPILGVWAAPMALILGVIALFAGPATTSVVPAFRSLWLTVHLATVFGGYGFFGLAFVAGVMYLVQEDQIKARRSGALSKRLPSLNALDNLNHYCLTIGFPLMTLGIITGAAYAQMTLGTYWRWDPKEVWSLGSWLVYAALLHQRVTVGWQGRRAALMAIIGFSVLCFTFLGVSLLLPGYHTFEALKRWPVQ